MNVEKMIRKDRSGIATLLIVLIVVVIIVVAAGAAYVVLSGNDDKGNEIKVEKEWAPGTKFTYELTPSEMFTEGNAIIELLGQNADSYFTKTTVTMLVPIGTSSVQMTYYEYTLSLKEDLGVPDGAVKTGTIQIDTMDGKKTLDKWENSDTGEVHYIDPSSGIPYGGEMLMDEEVVTLKLTQYNIAEQEKGSYTPSNAIGMTYTYSGKVGSYTYAGKVTCIADCSNGKYGIKYDLGGASTYFLSNFPQGLPTDAENTGATTSFTTIDGNKTLQEWTYGSINGDVTFYVEASSHIVYRFVWPDSNIEDGIVFNLTQKPA
jgi:hypothetical protein